MDVEQEKEIETIQSLVRDIPDYPKPGIVFKDITPLLLNPEGLQLAIQGMVAPFKESSVDLVIGAEARGFIFAPSIALELGAGFMPARKPGKLPGETAQEEYALEYGVDSLEIHKGQMAKGTRVLLVDDVLATGGTMKASKQLIEKEGGEIVGFSFLIELSFLNGREQLAGEKISSLLKYK